MNPSWLLAGLLGLAVVVAWIRLGLWQRRAPADSRSRGWRIALLFLLQPLCATLLYLTLLPPKLPGEAETLVVATAGATTMGAQANGDALIALPEAPTLAGAERVPDLATALRRHPGMQRLRIVGAGLEPRDRDAVRGLPLMFSAPALPRGVVRLDAPEKVPAGAAFQVGGRVEGVTKGTAELIDPAGRRVDALALPGDGEFILSGTTRVPGQTLFTVRVRDAQRKTVEEVQLPLWTKADPQPRLLLLAGAPSPELKYLRRWAADAGMALHTQISVGGGMQLGDAPLRLDTATLQRFDLVALDERSWAALGANERTALMQAVRQGLGLLLRVTGPVPDATRRQWQALGFSLGAGSDAASVRLPVESIDEEALRARRGPGTTDSGTTLNAAQDEAPTLSRRALNTGGADTAPLLRDADGAVLAVWRAERRGRIALWSLTDSYALVLSGQRARHAELWSDAFATLARAQSAASPRIAPQPRAQQRITLCGLASKPRVAAPDGSLTALLPDPAAGDAACAAYWPQQSGWHSLLQVEADANESAWPFFVYATDAAPGLHAAELREATVRLQAQSIGGADKPALAETRERHGPSWPWFLAWLLSVGLLWRLERARVGRTNTAS
ncbi:MAG TPA: carboxypeptidase regulatory-like domain-containing protein [Pseudoxanthomonas sp.]